VGLRYNPPPGWPPAPEGFIPPPGWEPDPSWPPAPPGWQLVVDDSQMPTQVSPQPTVQANPPSAPPLPGDAARGSYGRAGTDPYTGAGGGSPHGGPGDPYPGPGGSPSADATNPYAGPASPYAPPTNPYAPGGQQGGPGGQYAGPGGPYAGPGGQYGGPGGPYGAGGPYGTPYGGYGSPYPPGRPYSPKTSGWAIASFVIGLLGGVILSVIFGIVALRRIKRLGQQGRGFAIAGLALSGLWVLLIILLIIVGSLGNATRSSSTGQITQGGKLSVFSLAVGDCFDNPTTAQDVATVTAEPCNQPHSAQVYAKFNLAGSNFSYPGTATVTQLASTGCTARTGSIDRSKATNAMTVHFLFPDQTAWLGGRRAVTCMVVDPAGDVTYSLLKS
jgi:Domain of unknown function (DUF4190)/Septum formation